MDKKLYKLRIIFGFSLLACLYIFLFIKYIDYNKLKEYVFSTVSMNGMLKSDIVSTFTNNGRDVGSISISYDINDSIIEVIPDSFQLPLFVIYIPYSEEVCTSCISSSIENIKSRFPNFEENEQIIIVTSKYNPSIKGRVINKKIWHFTSVNPQFGIPADNEKMPHYFIITNSGKIDYFFSPNSLYPEITEKYIEIIRSVIGK